MNYLCKNPLIERKGNLLISAGFPWLNPAALYAIIQYHLSEKASRIILIDGRETGIFDAYSGQAEVVSADDATNVLQSISKEIKNQASLENTLLIVSEYSCLTCVSRLLGHKEASRNYRLLLKIARGAEEAGLTLIITDRHPMIEVLTKRIRDVFPCRMAFHTSIKEDSKLILGFACAEKLNTDGEALYFDGESLKALQF